MNLLLNDWIQVVIENLRLQDVILLCNTSKQLRELIYTCKYPVTNLINVFHRFELLSNWHDDWHDNWHDDRRDDRDVSCHLYNSINLRDLIHMRFDTPIFFKCSELPNYGILNVHRNTATGVDDFDTCTYILRISNGSIESMFTIESSDGNNITACNIRIEKCIGGTHWCTSQTPSIFDNPNIYYKVIDNGLDILPLMWRVNDISHKIFACVRRS